MKRHCKKINREPGPDGSSTEFYKHFQKTILPLFIRMAEKIEISKLLPNTWAQLTSHYCLSNHKTLISIQMEHLATIPWRQFTSNWNHKTCTSSPNYRQENYYLNGRKQNKKTSQNLPMAWPKRARNGTPLSLTKNPSTTI